VHTLQSINILVDDKVKIIHVVTWYSYWYINFLQTRLKSVNKHCLPTKTHAYSDNTLNSFLNLSYTFILITWLHWQDVRCTQLRRTYISSVLLSSKNAKQVSYLSQLPWPLAG